MLLLLPGDVLAEGVLRMLSLDSLAALAGTSHALSETTDPMWRALFDARFSKSLFVLRCEEEYEILKSLETR